jgi:hypothetical protein
MQSGALKLPTAELVFIGCVGVVVVPVLDPPAPPSPLLDPVPPAEPLDPVPPGTTSVPPARLPVPPVFELPEFENPEPCDAPHALAAAAIAHPITRTAVRSLWSRDMGSSVLAQADKSLVLRCSFGALRIK